MVTSGLTIQEALYSHCAVSHTQQRPVYLRQAHDGQEKGVSG
jgi:hypothetical protein